MYKRQVTEGFQGPFQNAISREDHFMSTNEKGTPQSRTYTVNDIAAILGIGDVYKRQLPYLVNQYFVFQDFFSLYLIAAGFPDMGYPYPGFPYLDKPYPARPHTAGPCPGDGASRR